IGVVPVSGSVTLTFPQATLTGTQTLQGPNRVLTLTAPAEFAVTGGIASAGFVTRANAGAYPALAGCSAGSGTLGDYLPVPFRCLAPYLFYQLRDPAAGSNVIEPVFAVDVVISNPDGDISIGFAVHYAAPEPVDLAITYLQLVQVVH